MEIASSVPTFVAPVKTVTHRLAKIVNDSERQIISLIIYVFVCGVISLLGTIANIINLIIFYKQGLNTTINISFFAMAVSDLCSLIIQQWFNIFVNPLFENSDTPMIYTDVQYMTGGIPRETFARITCLITAYITAERCLCIAFPLHIKQMITCKRTTIVIASMYLLTFASGVPFYCTSSIGWNYYPHHNKTLLGLIVTRFSEATQAALYVVHAILGSVSFSAVIAFTCILIHKLGEKSNWRKEVNIQQEKSISSRDRTTITMVVLIASILIVCYTPAVLLCLTTFCEPEFSVGGKFYNLYYSMWAFAVLFESVNSSVNIFLYFKMSTNYRRSFREMFIRQESRAIRNTGTV